MKKTLALIGGVLLVALLVWAFTHGKVERVAEAERERPVNAPSRVSVEHKETIVSLDPATQQKSAIAVLALESTMHRPEQRAYAQVLEIRAWSDARNAYLVAKGESDKARAGSEESRSDVERYQLLQKAGSASAESVLEANMKARANQATAQPADAAVRLLESSMREAWGEPLAHWLMEGSPQLDELVSQRSVLIQVSLPAAVSIDHPPPAATLPGADRSPVSAQLVSTTARVDPRFQGSIFFYMAPRAERGLFPGLVTTAFLPQGEPQAGVVVPSDAVVWWQGRAWVYVQMDAQRFARREIPTDVPVANGWFDSQWIKAGERVVNKGAQQLLSEEFRSQIEAGEDKK
ncbi:MAG: multidrug transporter [Chthoniobacterales bacterium]|nr:multidrug transporter [Chthoniobacterales bacterium]